MGNDPKGKDIPTLGRQGQGGRKGVSGASPEQACCVTGAGVEACAASPRGENPRHRVPLQSWKMLGTVLARGFTTFCFRGEDCGSEGPPGAGREGQRGAPWLGRGRSGKRASRGAGGGGGAPPLTQAAYNRSPLPRSDSGDSMWPLCFLRPEKLRPLL